jgi:hypothetical protein
MASTARATLVGALALWLMSPGASALGDSGRVALVETPDGGLQPQAMVDSDGVIHLVVFKGKPGAGDLYYAHTEPGKTAFSTPIRVNSQAGSAVAVGTIRGAQIALGKAGRVHVAWNGSQSARPENPNGGVPMLYARSDASRTTFEPQRNLMQKTSMLDGGGTIAADASGNVYVGWHARSADSPEGETGRRMWFARSSDDGATFAPEEPALNQSTGACGCCGTRAFVDSKGTLYALYRAAREGVGRDMILLSSRDRGHQFQGTTLQTWRIAICPMSSESLAEGPSSVVAAWETDGQVYVSRIDPKTQEASPPVGPPGRGGRKHPAVAVNSRGETIVVWAEGTGWERGGSLAWRIFDPSGRPTREGGRLENGVPVWSLPAVVARPDGGFTIFH